MYTFRHSYLLDRDHKYTFIHNHLHSRDHMYTFRHSHLLDRDHKFIFSHNRLHDCDQISWITLKVFLTFCHYFLAPITKNGTIWSQPLIKPRPIPLLVPAIATVTISFGHRVIRFGDGW